MVCPSLYPFWIIWRENVNETTVMIKRREKRMEGRKWRNCELLDLAKLPLCPSRQLLCMNSIDLGGMGSWNWTIIKAKNRRPKNERRIRIVIMMARDPSSAQEICPLGQFLLVPVTLTCRLSIDDIILLLCITWSWRDFLAYIMIIIPLRKKVSWKGK